MKYEITTTIRNGNTIYVVYESNDYIYRRVKEFKTRQAAEKWIAKK